MNYLYWVIAAGVLAVIYGVVQTASLLRASPGNEKMQEIAAAIQEGASAYLRRQYTTIGIVGVVVLIILASCSRTGSSRSASFWAPCSPGSRATPAC